MMQGRNRTQQLTVNSMLLERVRHRVERPLLVQALPVDRCKSTTKRTRSQKVVDTSEREPARKSSKNILPLPRGNKGKDVKLSGRKGIYSRKRKEAYRHQRNNNTRNRQLGSRSPQKNSSAKDNTNEMEKHTETLI